MTAGYRYPMRKCPQCGKYYANVKNHIAMKHADAGVPQLTDADLLGIPAPTPVPDEPEYFCSNCRAFVKRGDGECWRCGEELQWSSVV